MRSISIFSLAASIALLLPGCESNSPTTPADTKVSDAAGKIHDAADTTADAALAKLDEATVAMGKRLNDLNAKFDELKDRAAHAEGQAKLELETKLEQAKAKRDAAAAKLVELKEASADRWERVKVGVEQALDDLSKALE